MNNGTNLPMKTLDEIAIEMGTDKATQHKTGAHGYTPHYARAFEPFRFHPLNVLEIGVGGGESIRTWLEYFPNALVYGVDNVQKTNPWNDPESAPNLRYTFVHGDQSDETMWKCLEADHGSNWDIVIDDGGHFSNQIIISFSALWPKLKPGGYYCIEDLGVAYSPGTIFVPQGWPNHMEFIKNKLDEITTGNEIDFLMMSKELAIFRKKS